MPIAAARMPLPEPYMGAAAPVDLALAEAEVVVAATTGAVVVAAVVVSTATLVVEVMVACSLQRKINILPLCSSTNLTEKQHCSIESGHYFGR
jgi:hypothetical protein